MAKNRTVIGIICILLSLGLILGALPLINRLSSEKKQIVRITTDVGIGSQLTENNFEIIEVGGYNLPENVITDPGVVVGKYALCELKPGDYLFPSKLSSEASSFDAGVHTVQPGEVILTIPANGSSISSHLENGDIITLLFNDPARVEEKKQNPYVEKALNYVRILTTMSGSIPREKQSPDENGAYPAPSEIVLILTQEQASIIKSAQADGVALDYYLICKYDDPNAAKYIEQQNKFLEDTYGSSSPNRSERATEPASTAPINNQ